MYHPPPLLEHRQRTQPCDAVQQRVLSINWITGPRLGWQIFVVTWMLVVLAECDQVAMEMWGVCHLAKQDGVRDRAEHLVEDFWIYV